MFHTTEGKLLSCYFCSSPRLGKFGLTSALVQRYHCSDCNRTFSVGTKKKKHSSSDRATILNHSKLFGARRTAKVYKVSTNTIRKRQREVQIVEEHIHNFHNMNYIPQENLYNYRIINI